eukprot:XP_019072575.1 PREDICTED: cellulose synthase-like protein E1 [Vitis vinifera]
MEESSLTVAPSILDGDNYETWAVRMTVHLQALDVWEAVEENYEVPPLGANPTMAQMKLHKERRTRKAKVKACLFAVVSPSIFIKIMKIDSAAEIWEYLKEEYKGDERIKNIQVMNLIREFEMKKMRESDVIKDYAAQLLSIADKVRLLGKEFSNEKIVQKILVTLPEKYEATISSLENSKDLSTISLTELLHSLEVVEQRRLMRQGDIAEGAFQARMQKNAGHKNGKMGLIYGCAVEDIITGLAIICRGWKPVYFSPHKSTFLGVAPTTLDQSLIQDKRWSEGLFQILLSKYCPSLYGYGKVKLGARLGYCVYLVSSLWFLPFAYVFVAKNAYSILETVSCGETFKTLWNFERMWMMRSATSYLFAFIDNLIMLFGLSETTFVITAKVADEDVLKRYQHEIIEFGSSSLMFTIMSTLAPLNLFSSVGGIKKVIFDIEFRAAAGLIPHVILCGVTVMLHVPVYEALFVRNDEGQIPSSVMFKSIIVASLACLMPYLLYN